MKSNVTPRKQTLSFIARSCSLRISMVSKEIA